MLMRGRLKQLFVILCTYQQGSTFHSDEAGAAAAGEAIKAGPLLRPVTSLLDSWWM